MNDHKPILSRVTIAFGIALAVAAIVNGLLVVAKEISPNRVLPWMRNLTGHHWTTHCLVVLIIFAGIGFFLTRRNRGQGSVISASKLTTIIIAGTVISLLTIAGFYLIVG